jgi:ABC-2 type transport system permease protein
VVGLLFVLPILSNFLPSDIRSHVAKYLPAEAGAAIWTLHPRASESLSPWVGFGVLCAYALAALVAGSVVLARRDA